MARLFLEGGQALPEVGGTVVLSPAQHHHLVQVLRHRAGEPVTLLDGEGRAAASTLLRAEGARWALRVDRVEELAPTAAPRLTLLIGLLKADKLDLVVQKATELGVARLLPVECARSVRRLEPSRAAHQHERWVRIATAAAEQCRRPDVPRIDPACPLAAALACALPPGGLRLALWEESVRPLREVLPASLPGEVLVLVGPEGGLPAEEVAQARAAGFLDCTLGARVLRAETAALAILAVLDQHPGA